jgi:hypothetical protein
MASTQGNVYGHSDCWGIPFDFYSNATIAGVVGALVTGSTIAMQTGKLVFHLTATLAAVTVVLPLNPPDGADAEIQTSASAFAITSATVQANTNDTIVGTAITGSAFFGAAGSITARYKYSLNGDITKGVAPRSWIRVQ